MLDFFQSIASLIDQVITYIVGFFTNLFEFIRMVTNGFSFLGIAIGTLPSFLSLFILAYLSAAVIINVFNKGG